MTDSDDYQFEEAMERLAELGKRAYQAEFERLTAGLSIGDPDSQLADLPMPLEWHPAYQGQTWLIDWLNRTGQYAHLHEIVLPKPQRLTYVRGDELSPTGPAPGRFMLTRKRCAGSAPYVGRPFCYTWDAGVDDFGRCIAGEARIQYTVDEPTWDLFGDAAVIAGLLP